MSKTEKPRRWRHIQTDTFRRWANHHIGEPDEEEIVNLFADLRSGTRLCLLLERLSGETFDDAVREPTSARGCEANVAMSLSYMKRHKIMKIPIDTQSILNGSKPLTLSLIWCLILSYTMRSADQSWEVLMNWVLDLIGPGTAANKEIVNFRSDWRSGEAICALVNACRPGAIQSKSGTPLELAQTGITAAEVQMGVPPVLAASDMVHENVDELSVMTYLHGFRNVVNEGSAPAGKSRGNANSNGYAHGGNGSGNNQYTAMPQDQEWLDLREWVRGLIGPGTHADRDIDNFTTDWQSGQAICALVDACNPGALGDVEGTKVELAEHGMATAGRTMDVPRETTPEAMTDSSPNEQGNVAYLQALRAAHVKHLYQAQRKAEEEARGGNAAATAAAQAADGAEATDAATKAAEDATAARANNDAPAAKAAAATAAKAAARATRAAEEAATAANSTDDPAAKAAAAQAAENAAAANRAAEEATYAYKAAKAADDAGAAEAAEQATQAAQAADDAGAAQVAAAKAAEDATAARANNDTAGAQAAAAAATQAAAKAAEAAEGAATAANSTDDPAAKAAAAQAAENAAAANRAAEEATYAYKAAKAADDAGAAEAAEQATQAAQAADDAGAAQVAAAKAAEDAAAARANNDTAGAQAAAAAATQAAAKAAEAAQVAAAAAARSSSDPAAKAAADQAAENAAAANRAAEDATYAYKAARAADDAGAAEAAEQATQAAQAADDAGAAQVAAAKAAEEAAAARNNNDTAGAQAAAATATQAAAKAAQAAQVASAAAARSPSDPAAQTAAVQAAENAAAANRASDDASTAANEAAAAEADAVSLAAAEAARVPRDQEWEDLRDWILAHIGPGTVANRDIENFAGDWQSGEAICELVEACCPGSIRGMEGSPLELAQKGISAGTQAFSVPATLAPVDMVKKHPAERSTFAYLQAFRVAVGKAKTRQKSMKLSRQGTAAELAGSAPRQLTVEVRKGPASNFQRDEFYGNHQGLSYVPESPGSGEVYEVHVSWKGQPVPGSPFLVKDE